MAGSAPAPGGAPDSAQGPDGQGGGIAEVLVQINQMLSKVVGVVGQNPQIPDEAKQSAQTALQSYQDFLADLQQAAGGGGDKGAAGPQAVSPEAGGNPGAVPETMGARR